MERKQIGDVEHTAQNNPSANSPVVLRTILGAESHNRNGDSVAIDAFLDNVWQKACAVFPYQPPAAKVISPLSEQRCTVDDLPSIPTNANPLHTLVQHGYPILCELMSVASERSHLPTAATDTGTGTDTAPIMAADSSTKNVGPLPRGVDAPPTQPSSIIARTIQAPSERPLLFRNLHLLSREERSSYDNQPEPGNSLWAAYLDGCSIVLNHADEMSPWIAALCDDLQGNSSSTSNNKDNDHQSYTFPHVYANTYLTPAGAATAPPHADDRDVLVVQVVGRKEWIVYGNIPVPYPYPHEQVGKDPDWPVPDSVLQGPILLQRTLQPGDVLYMPRGYVHRAKATLSEPSFHITLALATHDWSLGGILANELIPKNLLSEIDYRRALPVHKYRRPLHPYNKQNNNSGDQLTVHLDLQSLQTTIDEVFDRLRTQITAETVYQRLQAKFDWHNARARRARDAIYADYQNKSKTHSADALGVEEWEHMIGPRAARRVGFSTRIRAATPQERGACDSRRHQPPDQMQTGLQVREDVADAITHILICIKSDQQQQQQSANGCISSYRIQDLCAHFLKDDAIPPTLCKLTLVALGKLCVSLGVWAIVAEKDIFNDTEMDNAR